MEGAEEGRPPLGRVRLISVNLVVCALELVNSEQ